MPADSAEVVSSKAVATSFHHSALKNIDVLNICIFGGVFKYEHGEFTEKKRVLSTASNNGVDCE